MLVGWLFLFLRAKKNAEREMQQRRALSQVLVNDNYTKILARRGVKTMRGFVDINVLQLQEILDLSEEDARRLRGQVFEKVAAKPTNALDMLKRKRSKEWYV